VVADLATDANRKSGHLGRITDEDCGELRRATADERGVDFHAIRHARRGGALSLGCCSFRLVRARDQADRHTWIGRVSRALPLPAVDYCNR
jgi:hypothetical protein